MSKETIFPSNFSACLELSLLRQNNAFIFGQTEKLKEIYLGKISSAVHGKQIPGNEYLKKSLISKNVNGHDGIVITPQ